MKRIWRLRLWFYIPFFLLCWLLAPILPLAAIGKPRLPHWLSWFMTPGDDFGTWGIGWPDNYWYRVRWLYRNPAYGLAWGPFAYIPSETTTYTTTGDTSIRARNNARAGWYRIESSDGAWEETRIRQLWGLPICLQTRTGWILGDAKPGKSCLYLLSIRPMRFNKGEKKNA